MSPFSEPHQVEPSAAPTGPEGNLFAKSGWAAERQVSLQFVDLMFRSAIATDRSGQRSLPRSAPGFAAGSFEWMPRSHRSFSAGRQSALPRPSQIEMLAV